MMVGLCLNGVEIIIIFLVSGKKEGRTKERNGPAGSVQWHLLSRILFSHWPTRSCAPKQDLSTTVLSPLVIQGPTESQCLVMVRVLAQDVGGGLEGGAVSSPPLSHESTG